MNEPQETDADRRARRCADILLENDAASRWLGITLEEVAPGRARCRLVVAAHHANGHGICHGGVIFSLADTTFAIACNSHNQNAVAQHNDIHYLRPGQIGDTLEAVATEVHRQGRSGVYDVRVQNGHGETLALFRGQCRTIRGQLYAENSGSYPHDDQIGTTTTR